MTPEQERLLAVAGAIAGRLPVDWAEDSAADDSTRATLRELKVIAEIAALHEQDGRSDVADRWGPLALLEHVGHGSFGDVYRALDTRLDREVALKLMRRVDAAEDPLGATVIEEGRLLARVRHPNVVTIYGADRIEGRVGLWMEFVRGRTLEDLLKARGPLPPNEVAAIGRDICLALAAVHEAGLLHRDIKAQNVVQEPGGRLVLMDFGAGREIEEGRDEALAGTPLYVAPEVLGGDRATGQSDVYSAGVLLYHLLTGAYPVTGRTVRDIRDAHRGSDRVPLAPIAVPALTAVVHRALEPDPARRYGRAADMAAALSAISEPPASTHRWRVSAIAAAVLVSIITVMAVWLLAVRGFWPSGEAPTLAGLGAPAPAAGVWLPALGQHRTAPTGPQLVCYGCGDEGGSIDSSGRWMVLTDRSRFNPQGLAIRDLRAQHGTWLVSGERPASFNPVPSSDFRKVAYAWRTPAGRAQLRTIHSVQGSEPEPMVVLDDADIRSITPAGWSADDKAILVVMERLDRSMEFAWVSLVDHSVQLIKRLGWRLQGVRGRPALSPDGRHIAYSALASEPASADEQPDQADQHIYLLAADGSGKEVSLVTGTSINESPVWTRDGTHVLFVSNRSGTFDLRAIPIRDSEAPAVPSLVWRDLGCRCITPHSVSAAGFLYYTKMPPPEERTLIVEMEAPGTRIKGSEVVVSDDLAGSLPAWSPDGRSIATKSLRTGGKRTADSGDYQTTVYSLDTGERTFYERLVRRTQTRWLYDGSGFLETARNEKGIESLYRVDLQSQRFKRIVDYHSSIFTRTMALFSQVSQDGATLYVFRSSPGAHGRQLAALDLNNRRLTSILPLPANGFSLKLSPDGRTLAFVSNDDAGTYLGRVDVTGENYRELYALKDAGNTQIRPMLAWTSDGHGILFVDEHSERLPPGRAPAGAPNAGSRDLNMITRQRVMHIDVDGETPPTFTGLEVLFQGRLQEISLNREGTRLAYGLGTGGPELWELDISAVLGGRR